MTTRTLFFKGRLVVACIAVLLALGVTALKRDDSRRKAVAGIGTSAAERSAEKINAVAAGGGGLLKGEGGLCGCVKVSSPPPICRSRMRRNRWTTTRTWYRARTMRGRRRCGDSKLIRL